MRVVPLEAFREKIPFAVAVRAVERGFRALALGEATLPDPLVMELAEQRAEVHVKGAHLRGGPHIVLKLATGFYRNGERGLPSGDGMFLLLDADRVFQTERYGNLHHAIAAGLVTRAKVYGELGDLAAGRLAGRERPGELTVADLTGVGVQDAAIAQSVVEVLRL